MKFLSTLVTQGSGVIGNLVVERNGVIRNRNIPANPRSVLQAAVRATLALYAQSWSDTLTPSQRAGWNAYAATINRTDVLGKPIKLSGISAYVSSNAALTEAGGTPVTVRPANDGGLALPAITSVVLDDSANTLTFAFAADITSSQSIIVSLSPASISLGRSKYSGPYRKFAVGGGSDSPIITIPAVTAPVTGEQWGWRIIGVNDAGQVSLPQAGLTTVVA